MKWKLVNVNMSSCVFQMGPGGQPPQYNNQGYGGMPQRHPNPMGMGRTPGPGPGPMKNNMMLMNRRAASAPYPQQMMKNMSAMPNSRPMTQYPNGAQVCYPSRLGNTYCWSCIFAALISKKKNALKKINTWRYVVMMKRNGRRRINEDINFFNTNVNYIHS